MKIEGLDGFLDQLENLEENIQRVSGTHRYDLDKIFNESFMTTHTKHKDFESFLDAGGFKVRTQEEFDSIDKDKLDQYVSLNTSFDSFEDMLSNAAGPFFEKELFGNL